MATDLIQHAFHGQAVRVIADEHGEPWFVLNDLCAVLDIVNVGNVAARLADDLKSSIRLTDGTSGNPNRVIVSESGMYEVVIRSDSPAAAPFRRWVTTEVLPSIRRTGSYGTVAQIPQDYASALRLAADEYEGRIAAEAKVAQLEPKAQYVDTFVADDDLRLMRNVAKSLDVQESALRNALLRHQWIYAETSTRWSERKQEKETVTRYSPAADKRPYFRPVPVHDAPRFKGEVMHTLKVTPAGASAIAQAARRWGLCAPSLEVVR